MNDGIKYVGTRQHLYDDPPTFPNGKVDHWKQFVQKNEKLDQLEKDYKNKLANKIVDKDYQNTKKKNPFTQAAERARDLLAYKYNTTTGTFTNSDDQTAKDMGEAVKSNELFNKNFQDQKRDDHLAKSKHLEEQKARRRAHHLKVWGISEGAHNPTVNKYKTFKDNKKKELEDKKYNEQFEKEYGYKAIEDSLRVRELKNKKEGRAPQADFTSSEQIVAEHAKDKARKKLAAIKVEPVKLEPNYIDYRLALNNPTPTISLEEHMAQSAPREVDPLGITGLAEVQNFRRSFDTANKKFNLRSLNGVSGLLGEYDEN